MIHIGLQTILTSNQPGIKITSMRKFVLILFVLPLTTLAQQRLNVTFFGGLSNYYGDMQAKRFTLDQSGLAIGAGLSYQLTPKFLVRTGLKYGKIGADDKSSKDPLLVTRNLNFKSPVIEANLLIDYSFFDLEEKKFSPYLFAGLAWFGFNPYTHDTLGVKYYLRNLHTEGQGLPGNPGTQPYKLVQMSIPFGGGVRFKIAENAILGYEIGLRRTSTDYLDDLSNQYAIREELLASKGAKAVELSYRGGELKNGSTLYPSQGARGGPKFKDWYYFQGITLSIGILNSEGRLFYRNPIRGSVRCPHPL